MKEIWINLELYFKRYDFYNFLGFLWIFYYLKMLQINIKKCKKRAGATRVRRGTQGQVAEPHGPAQRAYVVHLYILFIYYLYSIKVFFVLPYIGRVIPLETVGSYKPDGFLNSFHVGLILPESR